jgi:hypothetical protein
MLATGSRCPFHATVTVKYCEGGASQNYETSLLSDKGICIKKLGRKRAAFLGASMKNSMKLGLIAMSLVAGVSSAQAQSKGDWVLAQYKGGNYWYPGVIQAVAGGNITVAYDDGDRETLSVSAVRPYTWAIGGRVECNFKGAGKWYPGKIASLGGETIGINYDDGDRETTKTGRCRSQ